MRVAKISATANWRRFRFASLTKPQKPSIVPSVDLEERREADDSAASTGRRVEVEAKADWRRLRPRKKRKARKRRREAKNADLGAPPVWALEGAWRCQKATTTTRTAGMKMTTVEEEVDADEVRCQSFQRSKKRSPERPPRRSTPLPTRRGTRQRFCRGRPTPLSTSTLLSSISKRRKRRWRKKM